MRLRAMGIFPILLVGAFFRFWNLGKPKDLVFDEVYYVDGAKDLIRYGVELTKGEAEFVVHPPVGKWLIASGIKLFGDTPFGWRFAAALAGTASIFLIYLIARRLFQSESIALIAATLTTIDGLHLVMSRVALLDIFLAFFLLLSFLAFLHNKNVLAALTLGLALGTKWSAAYLIIALGSYLLIKRRKTLLVYLFIIPITYIASWIGWFFSDKGWSRSSSDNPILSLVNYHREILRFHANLSTDHPYEASPFNWLLLGRPTSFYYAAPTTCGAQTCSQEILALGNPLIWWVGIFAIAITLGYFISRRDNLAGWILAGLGANYLPWFLFPERTTFYFYAITIQPFLILAICYSIKLYLEAPITRKARTQIVLSGVAIATLIFLYFTPLYLGTVLTYEQWYSRMWLPSWI
jgi:dolichyl-phosphate-mannose-protein mannosyltransferase